MTTGQGTTRGSAGERVEPWPARVVLVGRTGLDAKLRLDPELELIRARTGLEAIGELANPVGGSAERTYVIVGEGSEIGGRAGSARDFVDAVHRVLRGTRVLIVAGVNHPGVEAYEGVVEPSISSHSLRSLIHPDFASDGGPSDQAVPGPERESGTPIFSVPGGATPNRRTEPTRPVPAPPVSSAPDPAAPKPKPDIEGSGDLSAEELALLAEEPGLEDEAAESAADVAEEPLPEGRAPEHAPKPAPMPKPETVVKAAASAEREADLLDRWEPGAMESVSREGDGPLVAAMLGGRGVVEPALGMLRSRAGRSDLEFVEQSSPEQKAPAGGAAVEFGGRVFGWLVARRDPETLTPRHEARPGEPTLGEHARWLAGWLALADQHRRLRAEAMTDRVSGAWNRRYFDRFLAAAIEQARAKRQMLTVLVFDLDNFKRFNDEFGHEAGDMILRETVSLMHSLTRPTDRICRIGGDEFAVIFYEPEGPRDQHSRHPTHFADVAERFQRAIVEQRFPRLGIDAPGRLTISGGLATFPWDGATPEDLLRKADQLALESKRSGKNGITLGGHKD